MKYDLSAPEAIRKASLAVRAEANCYPNQNSYNAAYLHGYAKALDDVCDQLKVNSAQRSICGMTGIQIKFLTGNWGDVEWKVNDFLREHDGNVLDVSFFQHFDEGGAMVQVVYKAEK